MARAASKIAVAPRRMLGLTHSGALDFLDPGSRVTQNVSRGQPLTGRNLIDPANVVLHPTPGPPPPPPTFPDTGGAEVNARRAVRRRAVTSGLGSTVLTGGYSPTGQASSVLGGG